MESDGLLPSELVSRIEGDATLTIEPHLKVFSGYSAIDNTEMKNKHVYNSNEESFDAACEGIKKVLVGAGYRETEAGWVK